jgi:hypothetical protein
LPVSSEVGDIETFLRAAALFVITCVEDIFPEDGEVEKLPGSKALERIATFTGTVVFVHVGQTDPCPLAFPEGAVLIFTGAWLELVVGGAEIVLNAGVVMFAMNGVLDLFKAAVVALVVSGMETLFRAVVLVFVLSFVVVKFTAVVLVFVLRYGDVRFTGEVLVLAVSGIEVEIAELVES